MSEGNAYCLPYAEAQCFRHTNILLLTEYLEGSVVIVKQPLKARSKGMPFFRRYRV
jgi:hypothetical protein